MVKYLTFPTKDVPHNHVGLDLDWPSYSVCKTLNQISHKGDIFVQLTHSG